MPDEDEPILSAQLEVIRSEVASLRADVAQLVELLRDHLDRQLTA